MRRRDTERVVDVVTTVRIRARLVTVRCAAAELGVTAATVRAWIRRGALVGVKPAGYLFVTRASLDALVDGKTAPPET